MGRYDIEEVEIEENDQIYAANTDDSPKGRLISPDGLPSAEKTNCDKKKGQNQKPEKTAKKSRIKSSTIGNENEPCISRTGYIFLILPQTRNSSQFTNTWITKGECG